MTKIVTIFKNIHETNTPFHKEIGFILERIKNGASAELVKKIRAEKKKNDRNELKKHLPSICFSGKFAKRSDDAIIEHSGLICLDFDNYEAPKNMLSDRQALMRDKYVYSVFTSPSGDGLKVLVRVPPDIESHKAFFNSLENHFANPHFDKTSSNISRVCYESHDPHIYINEDALVWENMEEREREQHTGQIGLPTIPMRDENKICEILLKWWTNKYPMVEGVRNQHAYVLAAALNDFGIAKSLAMHILLQYASSDFKQGEIKRTIDSAYSQTQNFGTKYYEDDERMSEIRSSFRRGVPKKELRAQLESDEVDPATIDTVLEQLSQSVVKFWEKSGKNNTVKIIHIAFKKFLEENGFYKYSPEGSVSCIFVRVTYNLIEHTSEKQIKDFVLDYLYEIGDMDVYNYFAENTKYFKEDFLSLLASINVHLVEDTKDTAFLYYNNCAVKITKEGVFMIDYFDLGGYVWKEHIIPRNFVYDPEEKPTDFRKFVHNICRAEPERIKSMESTIGFLLHGYKNLGFCPAVILNDEEISDNPEGGTGKGLFMTGIGKLKKLVTIDGKAFNFEKSFAYQLVSADTQIISFDDTRKNFDFERLFSVITEGLTLEKKNKDAIKIPFSRSPKISITTNYAIKGAGNSFARRKWELELHQHYTKEFTPLDEFGKLMFSDWNEEEWNAFDNYMIKNLMNYLTTGLVKSGFVNLKTRQFSAETCHEFLEWCGVLQGHTENQLLAANQRIYKQSLYDDFVNDNPDFGPKSKLTISRTRFYRWLSSYGVYRYGVAPEEGRDLMGRYIIYHDRPASLHNETPPF
jgi:hypothetical protein